MQCQGNSGSFPQGKLKPWYGATQMGFFFFLFAVFLCVRNPPHSDMDYRIFNVRTFLCVHIHTGVGHTDNESTQHFLLRKTLTNFSCAPGADGV